MEETRQPLDDTPGRTPYRRLIPWLAPLLALGPASARRRFQVFAVGPPRSGTHSLAALFAKRFRAAHEPMKGVTIEYGIAYHRGALSPSTAGRLLKARDKWLSLELEASHFLHLVMDLLPRQFPEAKFILTYRNPISWFVSALNQELRTVGHPDWDRLAHYRYGRFPIDRPAVERSIVDSPRIYAFESYFRYWAGHVQGVVDSVPEERLLVVPTERISDAAAPIAEFVGCPVDELDVARIHAGSSTQRRVDPRLSLPEGYLESLSERHCGGLVRRLSARAAATA